MERGGRGAGGGGDLYCGLEMYFLKDAQLCSTKQNSTCSLKKMCSSSNWVRLILRGLCFVRSNNFHWEISQKKKEKKTVMVDCCCCSMKCVWTVIPVVLVLFYFFCFFRKWVVPAQKHHSSSSFDAKWRVFFFHPTFQPLPGSRSRRNFYCAFWPNWCSCQERRAV